MRRVVVKVGSAVLTEQNRIAKQRMMNIIKLMADLSKKYEIILVSSGAVSAGYSKLKLDKSIISNKQALASIGQPIIMNSYQKKLEAFSILSSQVLVTTANFKEAQQRTHLRDTIDTLLKNRVLPIINENDATSISELVVGDNDQLSAYVTEHFGADLLVILSDIDAYYDADPRSCSSAKVLKRVASIKKSELEQEAVANNSFATGGIVTKLKAAHYLLERDKSMFLASGFNLKDVRSFLLEGVHEGGTLFTKGGIDL